MSDWSWKQAVAERVLDIVNRKGAPAFTLREVYAYTGEFSRLFPRNRNVQPKVRQILQRLRDDGFLSFRGEGRYVLDLSYEELEGDSAPLGHRGLQVPTTMRTLRNIRLRDTFLATEIKRRYAKVCQVCRSPLRLSQGECYAEAHHLKPLGSPHFGPDVVGNIVVLCPNHHVMFDRGVATIVPDTLTIQHHLPSVFPKSARLYLESWHVLNQKYLEYHHRKVFAPNKRAG